MNRRNVWLPSVDRIRVFCPNDDARSVLYWYNEQQHTYQFTRSETPLCVETDSDANLRAFASGDTEAFVLYVQHKHYHNDLNK